MSRAILASCLLVVLLPLAGLAHESRPAYLELKGGDGGRYELAWKIPRRGDLVLPLHPVLPAGCRDLAPPENTETPGGLLVRRTLDCGEQGLQGQQIAIDGLSASLTDVLVRVSFPNGESQTEILKPDRPVFTVTTQQTPAAILTAYLVLGMEHILFGIDHLLFVLGLLLLVRSIRQLVTTVTAFTLAHSVTLGAAALGFVHVPQAPVEASIALSIVFLATELLRQRRGEQGLAERLPWVVALCFGLLHGFGFAGALAEIGLPQSAIPLALFSFNLGVEAGQLLFVFAALAAMAGLRWLQPEPPAWTGILPPYAIGSVAAFWLIQRVAGF